MKSPTEMRYLLDSTLLIDHANREPAALAMLRRLFEEGHDLYTCDVVTCETLSFGGADSSDLRHIESLLDALEFVALGPSAARWAGSSRRARHRAGGKRAVGDALIAGLAIELGAVVVTRNVRDFTRQGVETLTY
ncbi:MAG: type II toxin-antitoxin system VapC family toxin [Chloroflexota bacterium]|nr:MAG: type II toxin-antitoxin system VapC family toxin [Chloroflexota bacterium]